MECYIGQIIVSGFGFVPQGFAACNGQLLPISQNQALFSLLGTMYGGDGKTTFGLPNLQGCTPVGSGPSSDPNWQPLPYIQGQMAGAENVTVQVTQLPGHNHSANASTTAGSIRNPSGALYGASGAEALFSPSNGQQVGLSQQTLTTSGGSGPHSNMQPFRVLNFLIATSGVWPPRS